jgi:Chaperone of endosialidase
MLSKSARPNMWTVVSVDENTQLSYAPQVNPSPLTVGSGNGSLEIVITNPTKLGISVKYVEFIIKIAGDANFPPYPDSTALTTTTADIKAVVSDSNWTVEKPNAVITHGTAHYRLKPMAGQSLEIPTGGSVVVQIYDFPINIVPGTSTVQIKEDTAKGIALPSFTVTTFPWGFAFSDLTANVPDNSGWKPVAQVEKTKSVTLFWHGSVLDVGSYTIYYSDSQGQQTRTPTKFGEWTSHGLTEDTVFTLGVSTNNSVGEPLQASMSVAVAVSEPDLVANSLTAENVGIRTSTPGFPLSFKDELGDKISLYGQSGASFGFGIQNNLLQIHTDATNSDIAFGSGSSSSFNETMRIKGNGNVGIGTSTPGFPLSFKDDVGDKISLYGQSGDSFGFGIQNHLLQIHTGATDSDIAFGSGSSSNFNETMRIKGNGNVGIGTSTPGFPLSFKDNPGDKISLYGQSGAIFGFGVQNALLQIYTSNNQADIVFGYGNSSNFTETTRIINNRAIQLGGNAQNPVRFDLGYTNFASKGSLNAEISNDIGTFQCLMLVGNTSRGPGWSDRWVGVWDSLDVANDLYVGGALWKKFGDAWLAINYGPNKAWAYWSDARLKSDVQTIPSSLSKVRQLRGVTFRWNEDGLRHFSRDIETSVSAGPRATQEQQHEIRKKERDKLRNELSKTRVGVVAQDVEAVLSEAVTTDADGYKSVQYDKLIPLLIEAIKEQDQRAERQQREIERLKKAVGMSD